MSDSPAPRRLADRLAFVAVPCHARRQQALLELLSVFHEAAETIGEPYWIFGGTLLGAARAGRLVPHDDDVDVWVRDEAAQQRILQACQALNDNVIVKKYRRYKDVLFGRVELPFLTHDEIKQVNDTLERDVDELKQLPLFKLNSFAERVVDNDHVCLNAFYKPKITTPFSHTAEMDVFYETSKLVPDEFFTDGQLEAERVRWPLNGAQFYGPPKALAHQYLAKAYGDDWQTIVCIETHRTALNRHDFDSLDAFNAAKQAQRVPLCVYNQCLRALHYRPPSVRAGASSLPD